MCALAEVYRKSCKKLVRLAESRLRDHARAQDAVHDAFAMTHARLRAGTLDGARPLYPYLRVLVIWRARTMWLDMPQVFLEATAAAPAAVSVVDRLTARRVWRELTPAERQAVAALHILEETVSRCDAGIYTSRIRIAKTRLRSLAA